MAALEPRTPSFATTSERGIIRQAFFRMTAWVELAYDYGKELPKNLMELTLQSSFVTFNIEELHYLDYEAS